MNQDQLAPASEIEGMRRPARMVGHRIKRMLRDVQCDLDAIQGINAKYYESKRGVPYVRAWIRNHPYNVVYFGSTGVWGVFKEDQSKLQFPSRDSVELYLKGLLNV